jgi:hypothetical protein
MQLAIVLSVLFNFYIERVRVWKFLQDVEERYLQSTFQFDKSQAWVILTVRQALRAGGAVATLEDIGEFFFHV